MKNRVYNVDSIEYIKATDTVKQVCLQLSYKDGNEIKTQKCVYLLNQDKNDNSFTTTKQDNKTAFKFKDMPSGTFIHNIYNTKDMFYKSAIYDKGKSERTGTTYDFKNIFSHVLEQPYKDVIQVENTLYAIADLSPYGHIEIDEDVYQYLAIDNNKITLNNIDIQTCLYDKNEVSAIVAGDEHADKNNIVKKIFTGVKYNTLLEMPGTILNENDSGNIAANAFKGKNQYNSLFDMEHTKNEDNDLKHARSYVKIDNCNNQIYFKYYDNLNYVSQNDTTESIPQVQHLTAIPGEQRFGINQKYQNIETIDYISRYANQYGHKSNLYSVNINTDIFDNSSIVLDDKSKEFLKNNIKSFVKNITSRMMPAHTQLFQVTIN